MFHILWSIFIGFIIGLIAQWFVPGAGHFGLIGTTLIGIGGSVVGGLVARIFSKPADGAFFHPAGFLLSVVGAILLLLALIYLF